MAHSFSPWLQAETQRQPGGRVQQRKAARKQERGDLERAITAPTPTRPPAQQCPQPLSSLVHECGDERGPNPIPFQKPCIRVHETFGNLDTRYVQEERFEKTI